MLRVPEERFPRGEPASLAGFLVFCRDEARRDGKTRIGSISLEVRHIDPLAVLQSIYDSGELHFYLEKPLAGEAIAGADAVESATFSGPERFALVRDWAAEVQTRLIAIGDFDVPRAGPHFFAGFTFADEIDNGAPFTPATVFLPRWQVASTRGRYVAVANVRVEPQSDSAVLAARVLAAHAKFSAFPYESATPAGGVAPVAVNETGGGNWFETAVGEALVRIRAGNYRKIVLARALDLESTKAFPPLETLNGLRARFPACQSFSLANGRGQSFIGATPERLARIQTNELLTDALAGSAPRGRTAPEDASIGRALLGNTKELYEHRIVAEFISAHLRALGLEPSAPERPQLLQLENVQHLWSPFKARMPGRLHLLDAVAALHPTPAVGGDPREPARKDITRLEKFDRGLYAGTVGWFDYAGEGEFVAAIRCALMDGKRARLYAGAGIVEGSEPAGEKAETDLKLKALLDSLC